MKHLFRLSTLAAAALFACHFANAQTAPAKPADATGQCKDGSYSTAASKAGACRGHSGVKEWYSTTGAPTGPATPSASTPPKVATPATPSAPSPTTQARTQTQSAAQNASQSTTPPATTSIQKTSTPTAAVQGGGPGMVWVNTSTNVYHCPGTKYYGKTKAGSYMSEADAKNKGARADHGTACTK